MQKYFSASILHCKNIAVQASPSAPLLFRFNSLQFCNFPPFSHTLCSSHFHGVVLLNPCRHLLPSPAPPPPFQLCISASMALLQSAPDIIILALSFSIHVLVEISIIQFHYSRLVSIPRKIDYNVALHLITGLKLTSSVYYYYAGLILIWLCM